jgi:Flavin containing amine oxidoreductase
MTHLLERFPVGLFDVTLFEATARLGGKILTQRFDTIPAIYEAGVAELYDYSHIGLDEDSRAGTRSQSNPHAWICSRARRGDLADGRRHHGGALPKYYAIKAVAYILADAVGPAASAR